MAPPSSDVSGDGDGWLPSGNLIVDLPLASVGNSVLGLGVEVVGDIDGGAEPRSHPAHHHNVLSKAALDIIKGS